MKWQRVVIMGAAWVALAGCGALQPVKQETANTFALEARVEPIRAVVSPDSPILMVSLASARPGFDSPRMAYVRTPHELEYFAKNQWVGAPARMLTPLLVQAAEASGAFSAVVANRSGVTARLRLESEIVRLQQEFMGEHSRIHFTLRVMLIDVAGKKVMATREFDVIENALSNDPYGGVIASNRALGRVLNEVAAFFAAEAKVPKQ